MRNKSCSVEGVQLAFLFFEISAIIETLMEMIFLGTSSGIPTKNRNVSATVVKRQDNKRWYLVDCGEGTQHQILHTKLSLVHLSAILITHVHGDHCFGLPGLLASAAMAGRKKPLLIVAPQPIKAWLASCQAVSETYLPYELEFIDVLSQKAAIKLPDFSVKPWALSHRVPSFAYSFEERQMDQSLDTAKLLQAGIKPGPIWGQLQQQEHVVTPTGERLNSADYKLPVRKPRQVIIGGDNDRPDLLRDAVGQTDVLVHESTFTEAVASKVGPGPQHSCAKQVAQFAAEVGLPNLILTHFSARYQADGPPGSNLEELKQEARAHYSGNLFLANDFDRFRLSQAGELELVEDN